VAVVLRFLKRTQDRIADALMRHEAVQTHGLAAASPVPILA